MYFRSYVHIEYIHIIHTCNLPTCTCTYVTIHEMNGCCGEKTKKKNQKTLPYNNAMYYNAHISNKI